MKRFGHLFEQIASFENLIQAVRRSARSKKSKDSVARYFLDYEKEVIKLQEELKNQSYQPRDYHLFTIFEPKERRICSSDFRDRVVHHAICGVIEPCFERRLISDTYACRTGKGSHRAVQRCQNFSRNYRYFLKCDISKYFESVDHSILKNLLARIFKDSRLMSLLERIIDHRVPESLSGKGLPIGNLTSQHFANLYLGELDHFVKERLRIPGYLRYMDDFVLFHDSKDDLQAALIQIRAFLESKLALKLKEKVTLLAPVNEGVPFLGFRVFHGLIRIQRKNLVRARRKINAKENAFRRGKITEDELIQSVNSLVAHIAHANSTRLRRKEVLSRFKTAFKMA
jgi:RNA-directed DNA polymerase